LCVSQALVSLSLPTHPSPQKEQRKRKTRKWVLGFFNTLSMGWEKDRPKYLGFELCPSSSKARPFAPKLSSKARPFALKLSSKARLLP
jgi:hypothetical protein